MTSQVTDKGLLTISQLQVCGARLSMRDRGLLADFIIGCTLRVKRIVC